MTPSVKLTDDVVQRFAVGKVHKTNEKRINSLSFTRDGQRLLSSSDDHTVQVYDCATGERAKVFNSQKYGVDFVRAVHSGANTCVAASNAALTDHNLRYWDLWENKYIRYFQGHKSAVTSLEVHPYEDLFLSSATDGLTFLWDLRRRDPVAKISGTAASVSCFDQQGLIFAVCAGSGQNVHLLDAKNYEAGEFASFDVAPYIKNPGVHIRGLDFTPDGKFLLVLTDNCRLFLVNAFDGELVREFVFEGARQSLQTITDVRGCPSPTITPDSEFVACAHPDGPVFVWRISTGAVVKKLEAHTGFARQTKFSPTNCLLATACQNLALWIPAKE